MLEERKTMIRKLKVITIYSFLFVFGLAFNASATPINTTANVVSELTVTVGNPLNFGMFSVGATGDTINFPANGTISTSSGLVTLLGGESIGTVTISPAPVTNTVTITLGSITNLTCAACGGDPMNIVPECEIAGGGGTQGANTCTFTGTSNSEIVQIGGSLSVNGSQAPGVYNGTIEVTAGYN